MKWSWHLFSTLEGRRCCYKVGCTVSFAEECNRCHPSRFHAGRRCKTNNEKNRTVLISFHLSFPYNVDLNPGLSSLYLLYILSSDPLFLIKVILFSNLRTMHPRTLTPLALFLFTTLASAQSSDSLASSIGDLGGVSPPTSPLSSNPSSPKRLITTLDPFSNLCR